MPSNDMAAFQHTLKQSKNIIAVAGAGLSAASGIPTFRGSGGMWRRFDAMSLATLEAFDENPARVWQFYHYRREKARIALPNAAHLALAALTLPSAREAVAPGSTFTLITQNVDGLSRRAHEATLARASPTEREAAKAQEQEQPHMLEMHGRLFEIQCTDASCGYCTVDTTSPICAALAGTEALLDTGVTEPELPESALPRCSRCGALARPGVVWFGEEPLYLDVIMSLLQKADLCIVVGTSSTVYPAAGYSSFVKSNGGKVAVFNLEHTAGDKSADFLFLGPCEETLPQALGVQGSSHEHHDTSNS